MASKRWDISVVANWVTSCDQRKVEGRRQKVNIRAEGTSVSCLGLMTSTPVSPDRKMFYRFKGEKIKTRFTELNDYSNVETTII